MTAKLIGNPRFIEELAPSGYVLTYETGTTNAKSVYQDSGQTAAHSGPSSGANAGAIGFTLNINGQATVYWASGLYRIRVYQSDDTLLYEIDNFDPQVQEDATSTINLIPNGSFEIDGDLDSNPDNWTLSDATLETITKETDQHKHGKASLKGISTGSGSGYATTDDFITIGDRKDLEISFEGRVDTITLNMRLRVYWYDESEVALGTPSTDVHSATLGTVDAWIAFRYRVTPPSGARLCKVEAYPVTNAIAGNAWMDNIVLQEVANPVVTTHTATATLTNADAGLHLIDASGGDVALTLPSVADAQGLEFVFVRTDGATANAVTIQRAGADTINGATSAKLRRRYDVLKLAADGGTAWYEANKEDGGYVRTLTADATLDDDEWGLFILDGNAATVTVTLPAAANADGKPRTFVAKNISNALTVQRAGADTINGATSITLDAVYDPKTLRSDGSSVWYESTKTPAASITQTEIASSAVGQSELKTSTTGTVSTAGGGLDGTLSGGTYGFYPLIKCTASTAGYWGAGGDPVSSYWAARSSSTSYVSRIRIGVDTGVGGTVTVYQRYFTASPPYNLGDGDVPLFIFAIVLDGAGAVESLYISEDPPWAYNGPTDISVTHIVDGVPIHRRRKRPPMPFGSMSEAQVDAWLESVASNPLEDLIVDQELKQADMPLIPHPFQGNDLTGKSIVLVDPMSPICEKLARLQKYGEDVNDILHSGKIIIDNMAVGRATPPGVLAHPARWKNTL